MSTIKGYWYPKHSSAQEDAELRIIAGLHGHEYQLVRAAESGVMVGALGDLNFSERIGNIPRKIILSDGSVFETRENDLVDSVIATGNHRAKRVGILFRLENHWGWIITALLVTLVATFGFIKWGLPWSAHKIAYAIPVSATQSIGTGVLDLLDKIIFEDSELAAEKQDSFRAQFDMLARNLSGDAGFEFTLHFRKMGGLPNAMALPSGDIVITDNLIEIAKNQHEIDAVLLHEIGHVVHRHGLQQVVQSSFVTVLIAMVTGDLSGSSDLLVAFPTFLLQSRYMRHHENDADTYAFEQMLAQDIDPKYFALIMRRMTNAVDSNKNEEKQLEGLRSPEESGRKQKISSAADVSSYFSTHPITGERIDRALGYSVKYAQQIQ